MAQVICFYSEHSPKSMFLKGQIDGMDFIKTVCLDNPELRERVMASSLEVTKVPTVMVIREDGYVEKYDDTAREWLLEVKKNLAEDTPPPQTLYDAPPPIQSSQQVYDTSPPQPAYDVPLQPEPVQDFPPPASTMTAAEANPGTPLEFLSPPADAPSAIEFKSSAPPPPTAGDMPGPTGGGNVTPIGGGIEDLTPREPPRGVSSGTSILEMAEKMRHERGD